MSASQQQSAFNYSVPPYANLPIKNITSAYTVQPNDSGFIINCTSGTFTVSLTAAATLGAGFNVTIWNTSATATDAITIDPSGAETIDGDATLILRRSEGLQIVCDGKNWQTGNKKVMRGYAENIQTALRASASGSNALAVGPGAIASGSQSVAIGYATASANASIAIAGWGSYATASSNYSVAIGNTSSGSASQALGGSYASGTDSLAAAVANNTSTYGAKGANSIAMGFQGRANADRGVAVGPYSRAQASDSLALGQGQAMGSNSIAIGSNNTISFPTANGNNSVAIGSDALAEQKGKYAYSGSYSYDQGGSQYGLLILRNTSTSATPVILTSDRTAPGTDDQVILPNNSAYAFTGTVVARRQAAGGTESAAWNIEGLIRREGTAASTTLVASTVTAISNVPGWTLALSADTTNGGLAITATGAAATNIRWVATVQTSEVTYA